MKVEQMLPGAIVGPPPSPAPSPASTRSNLLDLQVRPLFLSSSSSLSQPTPQLLTRAIVGPPPSPSTAPAPSPASTHSNLLDLQVRPLFLSSSSSLSADASVAHAHAQLLALLRVRRHGARHQGDPEGALLILIVISS